MTLESQKAQLGQKVQFMEEGGGKISNLSEKKRSSPLRPPLAVTQKELDTAAIWIHYCQMDAFSSVFDCVKQ